MVAGGALYLYRDAAPVEAFAVGKGPGAYYVDDDTRVAASSVPRVDAVSLQVESQRGAERIEDGGALASKGALIRKALSDRSVRAYADPRHARLDVALARFPSVWKSTSVSGAPDNSLNTKSFLGDDVAALAPSSGEEPASPRHRAGIASTAWRTTRRFSTNAP